MSDLPITAPAGYYPAFAVVFADDEGNGIVVDAASPLPVAVAEPEPETSTPLAGSTSASGALGPFAPTAGKPIWLSLSGTWTGTVAVKRSVDGGTTVGEFHRQRLRAGRRRRRERRDVLPRGGARVGYAHLPPRAVRVWAL
jgi:hypothetical protein